LSQEDDEEFGRRGPDVGEARVVARGEDAGKEVGADYKMSVLLEMGEWRMATSSGPERGGEAQADLSPIPAIWSCLAFQSCDNAGEFWGSGAFGFCGCSSS
jgi:hypothetical protein